MSSSGVPAAQAALVGRTVLVTGGNSGIGLGIARSVGAAGAQVVIWGRDTAKNAKALDELRNDDTEAHAVVCDVADEQSIVRAFGTSLELAGGRIDSVFANAGTNGHRGPFVDVDLAEWRRVIGVNLDGVFLTFREAARHLVTSPGRGGSLVAVSSTAALHGAKRNHAYGASKAGLFGLVRALAVELAPEGIRVNTLVPGFVVTEMTGSLYDDEPSREFINFRTPVHRWAQPSEMGPAAVFLADPAVAFHTGDRIVVDGGYTIY